MSFFDYPDKQRKMLSPGWRISHRRANNFYMENRDTAMSSVRGATFHTTLYLSLNRLMICQAGITVYAPKAIDRELTIKLPTLIELWPTCLWQKLHPSLRLELCN